MYIRKQPQHAFIITLILISLLGCSQKTDDLAGTKWELISLNGTNLIEGTVITLEFSEAYLGGEMGCNGYGGTPDGGKYFSKGDGTFELYFPLAVTLQRCAKPEGIMEQEAAYIEALKDANHYHITDDLLEINNEAGDTILIFQAK